MLSCFLDFIKYYLKEKIGALSFCSTLLECKERIDREEQLCGMPLDNSEKLHTICSFLLGLCIYTGISYVLKPSVEMISESFCENATIPKLFIPLAKFFVTFFADKKIYEFLDDLSLFR